VAGVAVLTGCQALPPKVSVDFAEPKMAQTAPASAAPARVANGSLFQLASYRPAFEDSRARMVGDIVTIQIVESLAASQVSKSTVNRNTSIDAAITPPLPGLIGVDMKNLEMAAKTNNDFSGKGGTEAANTFSGSISAVVIDVLPNGNLVVAGEKQIGVNQNVDVMRFSGTVNPRLLQPNNIISSTQVANVRVESRGRGAQGEAQTVGWLSRFFLSFQPF
jgi:flagellar L-ring protein FlgH